MGRTLVSAVLALALLTSTGSALAAPRSAPPPRTAGGFFVSLWETIVQAVAPAPHPSIPAPPPTGNLGPSADPDGAK